MGKQRSNEEIITFVNGCGSKFKNKYEFFKFHSLSKRTNVSNHKYVNIINPHTKKVRSIIIGKLRKINPFRLTVRIPNKLLKIILKKEVNKMGSKFKNKTETYRFYSLSNKKIESGRNRYVRIINNHFDKKIDVQIRTLRNGGNPFRKKSTEIHELHPVVFKKLKKIKGISEIKREFWISDNSKPDFVVKKNGLFYIIEVKNDVQFQTKKKYLFKRVNMK